MLKPNEIEAFSMMLDEPMKSLEMRIMEDIVRRIRINGEITRAADWQINRLYELGMSKQDIENAIKQSLDLSDEDIHEMYSDVLKTDYLRNAELYKAVGKKQIPFAENLGLQQMINAVSEQTYGTLKNITNSLGFSTRNAAGKLEFKPISDYYQQTLDGAMLDIASGAFDYNTVLKRVVNEITNSGLRTVDYATGWANRVDVAARRAVMTGMSQLTAKVNEDNMEALGTEYVEVSWHGGARPEHQVWQGKVYRWKEKTKNPEKSEKKVDNSGESGIIKGRKPLKIDMQFFAEIPKEKFTKYALDPIKQPNKAKAFREALGYTIDNHQDLIDNILSNLDEKALKFKSSNEHGKLYEYVMRLTGANGKQANVCTGWIIENGKSEPRLTSAYVTDKKVTKK